MNALARRLLPGRVARRVMFLFVLSAFIPLGVVAVMSLAQVRDVLLEEAEQRLSARSKAYGAAVLERLLLASEAASGAVVFRDRAWRAPDSLGRYFTSLGMVDAKGRLTGVLGSPVMPPVPAALQRRLASGKHAVVFTTAQPVARVFLLVPDFNVAPGTVLFGELLPDFLWGPRDILPAATEFCVIDDETRLTLFCSAPLAAGALRAIEASPVQSASVTWKQGEETLRGVSWGQFMRAEFGVGEWLVVASQPERFQLRRLAEFRKMFIPAVLLALLIVAWLSVRQIRAILVPVDELAAGARRIAQNDFSTQVKVGRDDEFGELAGAFNRMSAKLGRQFSALTALAEIDHLILSSVDTEWIIRTVLERIGDLVPADCASITLLDRDNPGLAHIYSGEAGARGRASADRQELSPRERETLGAAPRGFWSALQGPAPGYLPRRCGDGMSAAYMQPIIWRGTVCGALALAFRATPEIGEEDKKQIGDFADRVAVAISSAWRDEQLYQQAHFDALTGLPNRSLLKDRLTQEIARCQREAGSFALLFIDLDHFKDVNDTLGHASGDAALREAARRISRCLRESDTVSRLGGDEFNIILTQVQHPQDPGRIGEHIIMALSEPFIIDGQTSFLSASIGIALHPQDGKSADELIKNADTAMYRAKSGGRAQAVYFEEEMNAEAVARVSLDRELRRAIDRDELELVYQPVLDLRSGTMCGAEALLRWHHPTFGTMPPVKFIPMAEESGYIEQIGRWVLQEACQQMRRWQAEGVAPERLAVNVSPRQFRRLGLVELVSECARGAGVPTSCLEIEITETALIDHGPAVERMLRQLAARGVRISLDDFGTGFSSMAYLKRFPVHTVKVDRVFIESLDRDSDSQVIVAAIIAMSHALGKVVIAEGMETAEQLELLHKLDCDRVQGYHFCRPLPAAEFAAFARTAAARPARATRA